jgi:peptidoglycan/xylan/chitin deacetylase (PgdA/CDA1 family)
MTIEQGREDVRALAGNPARDAYTPTETIATLSRIESPMLLLWSVYRRHFYLCGVLLTFVLYALLLTGRGMAQPHFTLDHAAGSLKELGGFNLRSVSDVLAGRKYAVLTFDDAPYGYGLDEQIMAILRKHHARAVFFLTCRRIDRANRGVPGRLANAGHLVGNHGYDDLQLDMLSGAALDDQVDGCSKRLAMLTGKRPDYFRPPFGITSPRVVKAAQSYGMKQMLWNATSEDSWMTQPDQILDWSVAHTQDQSILLLHEKPATAAVLDEMLTRLEQRGFQFVLPDQLSGSSAID